MTKNIFILAIFAIFISACETTGDDSSSSGFNGNASSNVAGSNVGDVYESQLPELVPGSQEDLVAHVGDRIFFTYNSFQLSTNAQRTVQRQAEWLQQHSSLNVVVEGHCDERGTREYNLALGEKRASVVKNYLVSLGINKNRVTTISYGKEYPEDPESNEIAWSKNRRAVTVVNN